MEMMTLKKVLSVLIAAAMLLSVLCVSGFAADTVVYEQPFDAGVLGCERLRIPALLTLNDGSVMAAADLRYNHGSDSPQNIDTVVAVSKDGYTGWKYAVPNHFDDCADGATDKNSASFIDPALIQSKTTGRIFLVTDVFPSGGGYPTAKTGTGFVTVDGVKRLALTDSDNISSFKNFNYYIADYENGFAPVLTLSGEKTAYTVDTEYRLYKNGEAVFCNQLGADGVKVQQSVFSTNADLTVYLTCYLWMRYSDDNGKTWSTPVILSGQIKNDKESFLGICPGKGFVTEVDGKERIIFAVYDNCGGKENVSTIYSDDNGTTWQRGAETDCKLAVGKTSESQIVALPDGTLRMFARNAYDFVAYADSVDGGVSWTTFKADLNLKANGNCMLSFINYSKQIDGKNVVLGSFASDTEERADGVIKLGLVGENNRIDWITTYHINDGFFAYSCLTELSDGNIGILYEDEAAHISYMVLTVSDSGELSEVNANNIDYKYSPDFWRRLLDAIKEIIVKLQVLFGVI